MKKHIDIHTHVFNLNFIPVAGAVKGISKAKLKSDNGLPNFICNWIERHYLKKTEYNPDHLSKINKEEVLTVRISDYESSIEDIDGLVNDLPEGIDKIEDFKITEEEFEDLSVFIHDHFSGSTIKDLELSREELAKLNCSENDKIDDLLKNHIEKETTEFVILGVLLWYIIRYIGRWAYRKFLKQYLDWFNFMTESPETIVKSLYQEYDKIDLFIHHDMDMDNWYQLAPPRYDYKTDQVEFMSKLIKDENGKLICFYAYNPVESLDFLKKSIMGENGHDSKGYLGVKFYPPSGYKPWYNDDKHPYQKRNIELYQFCSKYDIPIFTHCNYGGMEAYYGAWKNSDVKYWKKVLSEFNDLTLCFGHSGGDEAWFGDFSNLPLGHDTFEKSFAGQIFELCTTFKNVYCGFGYAPNVLNNKPKFINRLHKCIELSKNSKYNFSDKIMYGTDYHMLMQEHGYHDYYPEYVKLFNDPKLRSYFDKFFQINAVKYLNLEDYVNRNQEHFLNEDAIKYLKTIINY